MAISSNGLINKVVYTQDRHLYSLDLKLLTSQIQEDSIPQVCDRQVNRANQKKYLVDSFLTDYL